MNDKPNNILWEEKNSIVQNPNLSKNVENVNCDIIIETALPLIKKLWKNTTRISGIYKIINKVNGKYYVGSSKDIFGLGRKNGRITNHIKRLKRNIHDNDHLQNAFNLYGIDNFECMVVEYYNGDDANELLVLEQKHLDIAKLNSDSCYNMCFIAGRPPHRQGKDHYLYQKPLPDDVKEKISNTLMGKYAGEKCYWYGKNIREDTKEKISKTLKGRNVGENNPMYGKHLSDEAKLKISKTHKGTTLSEEIKNKIRINAPRGENHKRYNHTIYRLKSTITGDVIEGTIYTFIHTYKLNNIYSMLNGKIKHVKNWVFIGD